MFKHTIDNKSEYSNRDGVLMKDLGEGIFNNSSQSVVAFTYYKNSVEGEMRPDKISILTLGTDEYTEMIMKYSNVDNPFAMENDDFLMIPTLSTIYADIVDKKTDEVTAETYNFVKNYHKYIDKNKVPTSTGSDNINVTVPTSGTNTPSSKAGEMNALMSGGYSNSINGYNSGSTGSGTSGEPIEANLANNGKSGIRIENGRIYFGDKVSAKASDVKDVQGTNKTESELVDCAKNGVTLGQFLNATIKNSI